MFEERLRQVRQHLNLTQADFASQLNIPQTTVSKYERGSQKPAYDFFKRLSETYGINLDWLMVGHGNMLAETVPTTTTSKAAVPNEEFVFVKRYDIYAAAGHGDFIENEEELERLPFKKEWIVDELRLNPEKLALIKADGKSMEPSIGDRDLMLVNIAENYPKTDAIYVINLFGMLRVKRLQLLKNGQIRLGSDNPQYETEYLTHEELEQLHIIGRVVWVGKMM